MSEQSQSEIETTKTADIRMPQKLFSRRAIKTALRREKTQKEEALQLARIDTKTGLPNEQAFKEELARRMAQANRQKSKLVLLYYDYDQMKEVNDLYSHEGGDEIIKLMAQLEGRFEEPVYRLHGDEFVRILFVNNGDEDIVKVMTRDRKSIGELSLDLFQKLPARQDREVPVTQEDRNKPLTMTVGAIGFTGLGRHDFDPQIAANELLREADEVMLYGKDQGRNVGFIGGRNPDGSIGYRIAK